MLDWARQQVPFLPARCMPLTFGNPNDDVGIAKQGNTFTDVLSNNIGDARRGQERYVDTRVRQLCESIWTRYR